MPKTSYLWRFTFDLLQDPLSKALSERAHELPGKVQRSTCVALVGVGSLCATFDHSLGPSRSGGEQLAGAIVPGAKKTHRQDRSRLCLCRHDYPERLVARPGPVPAA